MQILLLRLPAICNKQSIIFATRKPWSYGLHLTSSRPLSLNYPCRSLNNPFSPKSDKSKTEMKQFLKENARLSQSKDLKFRESEEHVQRLFGSIFGTSTLGDKFRKEFKLDENYKLIYMAENERLLLIMFASLNICFPILLFIMLGLSIAEFIGASNLSLSFDHPHQAMALVTVFFSFYYAISLNMQRRLVYRIYYNEAEKLFALVNQKRVLKFTSQQFQKSDIKLKPVELSNQNPFIVNMKKSQGNVTIKDRSWFIDFTRFNSRKSVEEFIGENNANKILSRLQP